MIIIFQQKKSEARPVQFRERRMRRRLISFRTLTNLRSTACHHVPHRRLQSSPKAKARKSLFSTRIIMSLIVRRRHSWLMQCRKRSPEKSSEGSIDNVNYVLPPESDMLCQRTPSRPHRKDEKGFYSQDLRARSR